MSRSRIHAVFISGAHSNTWTVDPPTTTSSVRSRGVRTLQKTSHDTSSHHRLSLRLSNHTHYPRRHVKVWSGRRSNGSSSWRPDVFSHTPNEQKSMQNSCQSCGRCCTLVALNSLSHRTLAFLHTRRIDRISGVPETAVVPQTQLLCPEFTQNGRWPKKVRH